MSQPQGKFTTKKGTKIEVTPMESDVPMSAEEFVESMEIPSNKQMETGLSQAEEAIGDRKSHLSQQGKVLAGRTQDILKDTKTLIHDKNRGEKLQRLLREGKEGLFQSARYDGLSEEERKKLEQETKDLSEDMKRLYDYVQNLVWNFLRTEDFRVLASDWIQLLQSLGTEKIKKKAAQKEGKAAKAVEEGVQEVPKPRSEEDLINETEEKLSNLLSRLSKQPEYRDALNQFFALWDRVSEDLLDVTENPPVETLHFRRMMHEGNDIIQEFAGAKEWDTFTTTIKEYYHNIKKDDRLNRWFCDLRSLLVETAENPERVTDDKKKKEIRDLVQRGRNILSMQKWRKQSDMLYEQANIVIDNIRSDKSIQNLSEDFTKFARDFGFNREGLPDLYVMEESIGQMKAMLVPLFREKLGGLPFKRIDISNETYDIRLEDMIVEGTGFFPERLDVLVKNYQHIDFNDSRKDKMHHELILQVDHILPKFKDMKFYYKRKSFPSIEDHGVANMGLTGEGATIQVIWKIHKEGTNVPRAVLHKVVCDIDDLDIKIVQEQTRHEILDTLLAPIVSGILKRRLSRYIEEFLQEQLEVFNERINEFFASRPTERLQEQADTKLKEMYMKAQHPAQEAVSSRVG